MSMEGPGPFFSLFPLHLQKVYFENDHPATAPQIETHGAFNERTNYQRPHPCRHGQNHRPDSPHCGN